MNTPLDHRGLPPGATLRPDEISPRDFAAKLKNNPSSVVFIDVRTPSEWDVSHVPGSTLIPLDEIEDRHDEIDEAPLVGILCHHGVRSLKAALALQHLGHKNVVSIFGGIELWSLAVDANIPRYTRDRMTGRCVTIK